MTSRNTTKSGHIRQTLTSWLCLQQGEWHRSATKPSLTEGQTRLSPITDLVDVVRPSKPWTQGSVHQSGWPEGNESATEAKEALKITEILSEVKRKKTSIVKLGNIDENDSGAQEVYARGRWETIAEDEEGEHKRSGWMGVAGPSRLPVLKKSSNWSWMERQHGETWSSDTFRRGRRRFGDTTMHERSDTDTEARSYATTGGRATTASIGRRRGRSPWPSLDLLADPWQRREGAEGRVAPPSAAIVSFYFAFYLKKYLLFLSTQSTWCEVIYLGAMASKEHKLWPFGFTQIIKNPYILERFLLTIVFGSIDFRIGWYANFSISPIIKDERDYETLV